MDQYGGSVAPGNPQSWNRYSYVRNDPINRNDPSGLGCDSPEGTPGMIMVNGACIPGALFSLALDGFMGAFQIGSGPPPTQTKGGWDTDPNRAAKTAWQYLTSIWSDCLQDFKTIKGFDTSQLQQLLTAGSAQGGMLFWDTRDPNLGSRTVDSVVHNGDRTTSLKTFVDPDDADVLNFTKNVVLGINFFSDLTQTQQIAAMIHEALHIDLKVGDGDLELDLAGSGFRSTSGASGDITDWISTDCGNKKSN